MLEVPRSLAGSRSGTDGTPGTIVSIVTGESPLATDVFPAVSLAVAVIVCGPSVSVELTML